MKPILWARKSIIPGINCLLLMKQNQQQVQDCSGKANHFQLGSTAGADANDPAYSNGGYVFSADDYIKGPLTINPEQDFAVYIVASVGASAPTASKAFFSFGNSGIATQRFVMYRDSSGIISVEHMNNAGSDKYANLSMANVVPGVRLFKVQKTSSQILIRDIASGNSATGASAANPTTFNQAALGCQLLTTATMYLDQTIYFFATCNRATTDAEDQQMLKYLRREMAAKGIAL